MNPQKKAWMAFASFFLVAAIIACSCPITPPITPTTQIEPEPTVAISTGSGTITSAEPGIVNSASGASIAIPAGAVPTNEDGSVGSMTFSIGEVTTTEEPSLPGGFIPAGPVVSLQPEGFVFEQPVTISLPIPSDVDPNTVLGAAYTNSGMSNWVLIPGFVDESTRTLQFSTTHFSTVTLYRTQQEAANATGGYFDIARPTGGSGYSGPGGTYSSATNRHGVCITSVVYADPSVSDWWLPPLHFTMVVDDYWGGVGSPNYSFSGKYWLPSGSYEVVEFVGQSERNPGDPLYIPHTYDMSRTLGTIVVSAGQTVPFPYPSSVAYGADGWVQGRPGCWGEVTTSVGTGGEDGMQITLNWNSNADIDLHVIEPGGDRIFWDNPSSTMGGVLDRDNKCENFIMGRPENIAWTMPPYGWYQVNVVYYADCGGAGSVNFTVRICKKGVCGNPIGGTVNAPDKTVEVPVTEIEFP